MFDSAARGKELRDRARPGENCYERHVHSPKVSHPLSQSFPLQWIPVFEIGSDALYGPVIGSLFGEVLAVLLVVGEPASPSDAAGVIEMVRQFMEKGFKRPKAQKNAPIPQAWIRRIVNVCIKSDARAFREISAQNVANVDAREHFRSSSAEPRVRIV